MQPAPVRGRLVAREPSVGVSLATERGLRLDLAGKLGGERPLFLAGPACGSEP